MCENIDDCVPNPCEHGATCVDGVEEYTCLCTLEYNRGEYTTYIGRFHHGAFLAWLLGLKIMAYDSDACLA